MIIDTLDRLKCYEGMHPLIKEVCSFLATHNLDCLPVGKTIIMDDDQLFVNIDLVDPKERKDGILETHRRMIDIQIPITSIETHGFATGESLPVMPYDEARDCTLFPISLVQNFFTVKPGQFVIYLPGEGHAPAICEKSMRKAIFKLRK